jgi:mRNA interferase MazF
LTKKSIADCLQTRPIDHRQRLARIRGQLTPADLEKINVALKLVFELE